MAVADLERMRINLVNDTVLPPDGICHNCPLIAMPPTSWRVRASAFDLIDGAPCALDMIKIEYFRSDLDPREPTATFALLECGDGVLDGTAEGRKYRRVEILPLLIKILRRRFRPVRKPYEHCGSHVVGLFPHLWDISCTSP